jgi:hypothetical protein
MIAIGTHFHAADAEGERRQARARAALLRLEGVVPINLQFVGEDIRPEGFRTLPVLRLDSNTVTGAAGVRKPIVSEMFGALAEAARGDGCRYFVYLNADIEVTQAAVGAVLARRLDGYAFSRTDVDAATGAELGVQIFGLDMFAIDAAWWAREGRRFRPYIAGEACWDNVYAALVCGHGRGEVINDRPGIYHQRHPTIWKDGPFAEHNAFLATLDAPYFSRWVQYATRLEALRKGGLPVDGPRLVLDTLSDTRLSPLETAVHAARQLRARFRYARVTARAAKSTRTAAASPRQSPRRSDPAGS